ncbi:MAG TPA: GNAT family N-acetyltransferase [Chloroflexi bacterium]|nr:GNAT family N-acetyltransferase [Chloroflexota bacterium]
MKFAIRPYHPSDFCALYTVCLKTGDSGQDATALFRDPELLGHLYVGPYVVAEPELCFTLTADGAPCGYVLGTRDSARFHAWCEQVWFPVLRQRYPLPSPDDDSADARLIRNIHAGDPPEPALTAYPAHLHIDLLPVAQGQGWGRRMIETLLNRLRELGAPGVHLGVGKRNTGAIQFYERVGFHRVLDADAWIAYGMKLDPVQI